MRLAVRLLLAAALAAIPVGIALASCSSGAVGVQACRDIETARCNAAPACTPGFDVNACTLFYHDECLVGLGAGNGDAGDDPALETQAGPCVAAINACAMQADASTDAGCSGEALEPGVPCTDAGLPMTPCNIILHCPEVMAVCNFVAIPDAGADAADGSDGSDAAETGTGGAGGGTG